MSLDQTYAAATTRVGRLDHRDLRTLRLIALGHTEESIAARVGTSREAVVRHSRDIFSALDLTPSADVDGRLLAVLTLRQAWGDR
ncbi:hypothetical protein FXB39_05460 [Nocardioides sp. BGMRC 2183]|nr:hypothetical protein FXB39_05460 [Nocardioides sp. BGMRC 2183]